jgi:hypothetical protein
MSLTKKSKTKYNSKKNISNTKTCKNIKGINIYKITNIFHKDRKCWDCAYGFIVIAKNELSARQIIYKEKIDGYGVGDEEYDYGVGKARENLNFWLKSEYSKCELIGKSCLKNEGIVLRDFQDG